MVIETLKDKIRSNFVGKYAISLLHEVECAVLPKIINDEKAIKRYYKKCKRKELNLDNPKTFSEKLNWYKLYDHNPLMVKCADKYAVREYIKEQGCEYLLNELYGVYDSVNQIDISQLPNQFVLKAAHGSHMNIIVKDKTKINWKQAKLIMASWLRQDIYWSGREWCYKDIPRRIIAEKYLEDKDGELKDYKIHCFNGKPYYLEYLYGRYLGNFNISFYNKNLEKTNFKCHIPVGNESKPSISIKKYKEMLKIAGILSKPFQNCRVDFYCFNDKIYFGELTFYDNGGNSTIEDSVEFAKNWELKRMVY